jgi:hypothetical protein
MVQAPVIENLNCLKAINMSQTTRARTPNLDLNHRILGGGGGGGGTL